MVNSIAGSERLNTVAVVKFLEEKPVGQADPPAAWAPFTRPSGVPIAFPETRNGVPAVLSVYWYTATGSSTAKLQLSSMLLQISGVFGCTALFASLQSVLFDT